MSLSTATGLHVIQVLILQLLLLASGLNASDGSCPDTAGRPEIPQPAIPKQPRTLDPYSITQTVEHYYDAPLGVGFLQVIEEERQYYSDWMFELDLPLWHAPDAVRPLGWLTQGRIYSGTSVETLTGAGMVETDYEHSSFIVWQRQEDWIKLRLREDLYAWTHRCHLQSDKFRLEPILWQTFFRQHADWLHFRRPVPHVLRNSPGAASERMTTVGLDHKLVLLDVRGDWMEVEVEQPDLTCSGLSPGEGRTTRHRGWVKWRDERGPWVFVYTRGC